MSAFAFTPESEARIAALVPRYPDKQAALLPVLWIAQEQVLSDPSRKRVLNAEVIEAVGEALGLSPAYVWGVATFYTMYHTRPVGRHLLEVCTSVGCCLTGGEELYRHLCSRLGVDPEHGGTTEDGVFTLRRAECLAACGYAPMLQLDEGPYVERLTAEAADRLIDKLRGGEDVSDMVAPLRGVAHGAGETPALPGSGEGR